MFSFFKKPAFGLDISDFSIEVLQLQKRFNKVSVRAYNREVLKPGIVENGKILDEKELELKIKKLLSNAYPKPINTNKVVFSLPESKTFIDIFEFSKDLKGEELKVAVKDRVAKTVPINLEQVYDDFMIVSEKENFQEVLYASAFKTIVDGYLKLFERLDLVPVAIDLESLSLTRAFKDDLKEKYGAVLIADIGDRTTNLTVYDQGIRLTDVVFLAGGFLTRKISEAFNISLKEAEQVKKRCSQEKDGRTIVLRAERTFKVLQKYVKLILDRIDKCIDYYQDISGRKIVKILLCGGSSLIPELPDYFKSYLGIEAKLANPFSGIDAEILRQRAEQFNVHPIFFSNVVGLAKRGLTEKKGINLIPKSK